MTSRETWHFWQLHLRLHVRHHWAPGECAYARLCPLLHRA